MNHLSRPFAVQINGQLNLGLSERRLNELIEMVDKFVERIRAEHERETVAKTGHHGEGDTLL